MRVHHLNCGTMCPVGRRVMNGEGSIFAPARLVCHCLAVETGEGILLVDTGLGLRDIEDPRGRLGGGFVAMVRPALEERETAVRQIEGLGFKREDVRHIVPTHLDSDHAGGLADFPDAKVHVYDAELEAALAPRTVLERERYRQTQWAHGPAWDRRKLEGDVWFGFDAVRAVPGLGDEVLLVPLMGHTRGHCGVAVKTGDRWLLHGGDSFFYFGEVLPDAPHCPAGLRAFQRIMAVDNAQRVANQARLRELARAHCDEVQIVSAHCPFTFDRLTVRGPRFAAARGRVVPAEA